MIPYEHLTSRFFQPSSRAWKREARQERDTQDVRDRPDTKFEIQDPQFRQSRNLFRLARPAFLARPARLAISQSATQ
jgi:hypothetical protein